MAKKATETYNLVIVESPAKAKTIEKFLGEGYVVKSSYGHIRDLLKTSQAIDIANNYAPQYVVPDDKQAVVNELRKLSKKASFVWLASDEDREGEAISWHLAEVLGLDVATTKRIVFHEITKEAILRAIETPRTIDMNLVDAQQARRVLDRLVGFELSPVLWHKVKPQLSAGRVQSVALRLLVERERDIFAFTSSSNFLTTAIFSLKSGKSQIKAELNKRFAKVEEAESFLKECEGKSFTIGGVEKKPLLRAPAPPFTTSTLQQEASRKLGFAVSRTMSVAQRLYEAGHITYMRTDSLNLAEAAVKQITGYIKGEMGDEYLKVRHYKTQSKGAQEAHEAIRPTYINVRTLPDMSVEEQKLYQLIWQRTIASQMQDAKIEKTTIRVDATATEYFTSAAEVVLFDGFMKVYTESYDEEDESNGVVKLPKVNIGDQLDVKDIQSRERWQQHPPRYNEATLVKKLEELGIGRPSTYAPTISTIQQRGYVIRETREGEKRSYVLVTMKGGKIVRSEKSETVGAEKNKLFPTDIGMIVNDFLIKYFQNVVSYDFTAKVEEQFDDIADGRLRWQSVIDEFYKPFHNIVEDAMENSSKSTGERILGVDPATGKQVSVRVGRFGPMAQIGESGDETDDKPRYSSLRKDQHVETITLEEALKLFELPRHIGEYEGKEVVIGVGKFGPYAKHDNKFYSLKRGEDDPYTIDIQTAIQRIEDKREADRNKLIKEFDEDSSLKVLNGRWGPYIAYGKENVRIPKGVEASELTYEQCLKYCKDQGKLADDTKKAKKSPERQKNEVKKGEEKAKKTSELKSKTKKVATKK